MARGGKRAGAGRPKGDPTRTVRVAARAAEAAPILASHFLAIVESAFRQHYAETIAREQFEPTIQLIGIEEVEVKTVFSTGLATVLVAEAEMGGILCTFTTDLFGAGFHSRSEEEI